MKKRLLIIIGSVFCVFLVSIVSIIATNHFHNKKELLDKTFNIMFLDYNGTILKEENLEKNLSATAPSNPTREGYEFIGWSEEFSNITKDLTIIAQYKIHEHNYIDGKCSCGIKKEKSYSVVFKDYKGVVLDEQTIYEFGTAIAPKVPTREGYEFIGWDKEYSNIIKDTVLIAQYKIKVYNVIFDTQKGTVIENQEIEHNGLIEIPEKPIKDGYIFVNWQLDGYEFDFNTQVTRDITLTANWVESPIEFELNANEDSYSVKGLINTTQISIPAIYNNLPVVSICKDAFKNFSKLTSIEIPNSIVSIEDYAFYGCDNLEKVYYNGEIYEWCNISFVNYSSNPMCVGKSFYIKDDKNDYYELDEIIVPSTISMIGDYQFYGFKNIKKVDIHNNVLSIGKSSFEKCNSLLNVFVPDSVLSIGQYAFSGCSALANIIIPKNVTSIGQFALYECDALESLTIPFVGNLKDGKENTNFGYIFGASSYSNNEMFIPSSLNEVIVTGEKIIDDYAFYNCRSLVKIVIPEGVTTIGFSAFSSCSSLQELIIPTSIVYLGQNAFDYCDNLKYNIYDNANYLGNENNKCLILIKASDENISSCTIHDDTKVIAYGAFSSCQLIREIVIPEGLTNIGNYAFYNCSSLISVEIPKSIRHIGDYSFNFCNSLNELYYKGLIEDWCNIDFTTSYSNPMSFCETFYMKNNEQWEKIVKIEIPNSVQKIKNNQFYGFSNLESIVLSNSIVSIGDYAFAECIGLKTITIPDSTKLIGKSSFQNCINLKDVTLSSNLETIGENAFSNCSILERLLIPDSVTSVGTGALMNCNSLVTLVIPSLYNSSFGNLFGKNNTGIGYSYNIPETLNSLTLTNEDVIIADAFSECNYLEKIIFTNSIKKIAESAFKDCDNLTDVYFDGTIEDWCNIEFGDSNANPMSKSLYLYIKDQTDSYAIINNLIIPESIAKIGSYQFYGINTITNIILNENIYSIGNYAFGYCNKLETIKMFDSITSIGEGAFYNCSSLTKIEIPSGITCIYDKTFYNCTSLENIGIDGQLREIGDYAFYSCSSLVNIEIPNTLLTIGSYAFYNCDSLSRIVIPTSVTTILSYAFGYCENLHIYCKISAKPKGWNSSWKTGTLSVTWGHTE